MIRHDLLERRIRGVWTEGTSAERKLLTNAASADVVGAGAKSKPKDVQSPIGAVLTSLHLRSGSWRLSNEAFNEVVPIQGCTVLPG